MRVRAKTQMVEGFPPRVLMAGDEFDLSDSEGVVMLRSGLVERVDPAPEMAAVDRGEKAVRSVRPVK